MKKRGSSLDYHTIFDISQASARAAMVWEIIPLLTIIPGLIGWGLKRDSSDIKTIAKASAFKLFSGFAFLASLVGLAGSIKEHHRLQKQLQDGSYQVVEGTVQDFVPVPPEGHALGSFQVGATTFHYGYGGLGNIGFESEFDRGGYIRDGVHVRITYDNQRILRVEVR